MLCHIEKHYPQYQMDFVINPGNIAFRKVLESRRATFATEQIKLLCEKPAQSTISSEIILLNENYEEVYKALHQKNEIELYESVGFERVEGQNSLYASY